MQCLPRGLINRGKLRIFAGIRQNLRHRVAKIPDIKILYSDFSAAYPSMIRFADKKNAPPSDPEFAKDILLLELSNGAREMWVRISDREIAK